METTISKPLTEVKGITDNPKARRYRLKETHYTPPYLNIPSMDNPAVRLTAVKPSEPGVRKSIRYSRVHLSPFVEDQKGEIFPEFIEFIDGWLNVGADNLPLQAFLHFHPSNGLIFEENDTDKAATKEQELFDLQFKAESLIRELDMNSKRSLYSTFKPKVDTMTDLMVSTSLLALARKTPSVIIDALNNPEMKLHADIQRMFDVGVLQKQAGGGKGQRSIHFNVKQEDGTMNNNFIFKVPPGRDYVADTVAFMKDQDNAIYLKAARDAMKSLEN